MKPAGKRRVRDLANGRPGRDPGPPAVRTANKKSLRLRREGWDERFVVGLAFLLAAIVAVVTIYQTIAWARG
jgi:hypothetical protein